MKVSFLSMDDNDNKVSFVTDVIKKDNRYLFNDLSTTNTQIEIEILGSNIRLVRTGDITMYMLFDVNFYTSGSYRNSEGLSFDFDIKTTRLDILSNKIRIDYDMILEKEILSSHKISLLFN